MDNVSLCMIVRNEEHILRKSLKSIAAIADEIIITDTGSTDKTVQIAKDFTDNILHFQWIDDFSAARNFVQSKASKKYILRWDADFVLRSDINNLKRLKQRGFYNKDLVSGQWNVEFNKDNFPLRTMRNFFFYKREVFSWKSAIHNNLVPKTQNRKVTNLFFRKLIVDHLKDPELKKDRYIQTAEILRDTLSKDPQNLRLLVNQAENYVFLEDLINAEKSIDKFFDSFDQKHKRTKTDNTDIFYYFNAVELGTRIHLQLSKLQKARSRVDSAHNEFPHNPRITLSKADVYSFSDIEKAKKLFTDYLEDPVNPHIAFSYNYQRYKVHPLIMLATLNIADEDMKTARKYLEIALRLAKTKESKKIILRHLKSL
jgi:glycosyltransferase involved in cell wall biosynthesis